MPGLEVPTPSGLLPRLAIDGARKDGRRTALEGRLQSQTRHLPGLAVGVSEDTAEAPARM